MFYIIRKCCNKKIITYNYEGLEGQLSDFPQIIRCHKSYLINIHQISRVSGNSRGYSLHFVDDMDPIPISRGYQKDVMSIIKQFREEIS